MKTLILLAAIMAVSAPAHAYTCADAYAHCSRAKDCIAKAASYGHYMTAVEKAAIYACFVRRRS
jgi:hypothetical protein